MCPGRELGKLEILIFLRVFLSKFDYDVVEGQVSCCCTFVFFAPAYSSMLSVLEQR